MRYNQLLIVIIFLQIFIYDWGIFELSSFSIIVNFLKILLPILLFSFVYKNHHFNSDINFYIITYLIFIFFGLISTLISSEIQTSLLQFLKIFVPRFIFIISLFLLLYNNIRFIDMFNKIFFYIGIFSFFQFLIAVVYIQFFPFEIFLQNFRASNFAGPLGLFGNVNTQFNFSQFGFPFDFQYLRLSGFWFEPSNAGGFLASTFFLGLYLRSKNKLITNNFFVKIPLFASILTISNAAYLSLIFSYSSLLFFKTKNIIKKILIIFPFFIIIIFIGFGRDIVQNYFPENSTLKLITGVRVTSQIDDFSGGRIDNYIFNFKRFLDNPLGIGFRIPGDNELGEGDDTISASAFFYILVFTGFGGIFCVLMLKFQVINLFLKYIKKNKFDDSIIYLFCAWVAVSIQNLIYGTWMSFYYYYLSIAIIVLCSYYLLNKKYEANS